MTTATLTLSEFLLERIGEDEATARAAKPGPWHWEGDREHHGSYRLVTSEPAPERSPYGVTTYDPAAWKAWSEALNRRTVADGTACDEYGAQVDIDDEDAAHIARWDPRRVLAECEAKRRIVELHRDYGRSWPDVDHACTECGAAGEFPVEWPCETLRLGGLPYADHPDYNPEWRP